MSLYTWDLRRKGELGHRELDRNCPLPRPVVFDCPIKRVASGEACIVGIDAATGDGRAFVWGNGVGCALGQGRKLARGYSARRLLVTLADGQPLADVCDIGCSYRYSGVVQRPRAAAMAAAVAVEKVALFGQLGVGAASRTVAWPRR